MACRKQKQEPLRNTVVRPVHGKEIQSGRVDGAASNLPRGASATATVTTSKRERRCQIRLEANEDVAEAMDILKDQEGGGPTSPSSSSPPPSLGDKVPTGPAHLALADIAIIKAQRKDSGFRDEFVVCVTWLTAVLPVSR